MFEVSNLRELSLYQQRLQWSDINNNASVYASRCTLAQQRCAAGGARVRRYAQFLIGLASVTKDRYRKYADIYRMINKREAVAEIRCRLAGGGRQERWMIKTWITSAEFREVRRKCCQSFASNVKSF